MGDATTHQCGMRPLWLCAARKRSVLRRLRSGRHRPPSLLPQRRRRPSYLARHTSPPTGLVGVRRGVRCTAYALDLAAITSPALPLAMTAAIFKLAEVAYVVTPAAFLAGGCGCRSGKRLTGMSFGKAMLGLRAIRLADQRPPLFYATVLRGVLFAGTAGLAALPVLSDSAPCDGWHDRLSGITLIDISMGDNPLGPAPADRAAQADRSWPEGGAFADPCADRTHPSAIGNRIALGLSLDAAEIHLAP